MENSVEIPLKKKKLTKNRATTWYANPTPRPVLGEKV